MSFTNKQRAAKWAVGFIQSEDEYIAFIITPDEVEQQTIIEELNELLEFVFYFLIESVEFDEDSEDFIKYHALENLLTKLLSDEE